MPGFDGTGPRGQGSRTGRGMGNCNQSQGQGFGQGRGFGRGSGMGQGRYRFTDVQGSINQQERLEFLKASKRKIDIEIEALEKESRS